MNQEGPKKIRPEMILVAVVLLILAIGYHILEQRELEEAVRESTHANICAATPMEKGCPEREKLELWRQAQQRLQEDAEREAEHQRIHDFYH